MLRLALFAAVISTHSAYAGEAVTPVLTATEDTQTRAFIGLNWTFGSANGPEGVLGVARVKTDSDGDSNGAKVSVHMPLSNGISFGKIKLTGLMGENDRMGEIGLGFGAGSVFGTAGLWAPFVNAGADIGFDGSLEGYLGLNTLQEWNAPAPIVTAEPPAPPPEPE